MINETKPTVRINGITYEVLTRRTTEEMKANFPLLAADMDKRGIAAMLTVKRPRGSKHSFAYEAKPGKEWRNQETITLVG